MFPDLYFPKDTCLACFAARHRYAPLPKPTYRHGKFFEERIRIRFIEIRSSSSLFEFHATRVGSQPACICLGRVLETGHGLVLEEDVRFEGQLFHRYLPFPGDRTTLEKCSRNKYSDQIRFEISVPFSRRRWVTGIPQPGRGFARLAPRKTEVKTGYRVGGVFPERTRDSMGSGMSES
jgi:hypothetical protein